MTHHRASNIVSPLEVTAPHIRTLQNLVTNYYLTNGRRFYWRTNRLTPWEWLVLELLLKRTRAEVVHKFLPSFINKYRKPKIVTETSDFELRRDLQRLGLGKQRCAALKAIATSIQQEYGGQVPYDEASLLSLPHVGLYISRALQCFCYGIRKAVVDSNIARVLSRVHGRPLPRDAREEWIWKLAETVLPRIHWREYNYGLLDIGARLCKSGVPRCQECCLKHICKYAQGKDTTAATLTMHQGDCQVPL